MFSYHLSRLAGVGFVIALAAFCCLFFTHRVSADSPSPLAFALQDLGPLPFISDDVSPGLNDAGEVSFWCDTATGVQGAVWSKGHVQVLGSATGYLSSLTHGLSAESAVVGWDVTSANSVDSRAVTRAAVWRKNQVTLLGTLGGRNSQALGINAGRTVVGVSQCADGSRHAFSVQGSTLRDLGTLPGGDFSQAYAINTAGQIVGVSNSKLPYNHAACWTRGRIQDLGLLPGGRTSSARAINQRGQIAGFADTPDGTHAFLYTEGRMLDLGTLGADPSNAAALNDLGQVVGTAGFADDQHHAFLWQSGTMFDLNTLISHGSPWTLLQACAINNHSQIVCVGHRKGGEAHLLLLTPAH